jgi:trans-2,3-dihydro-3-hydroxyanthranilate isomerase
LKLDVWARVTADASSKDIYVYAAYGREAAADLRVRHFAPALGILEDPATGGAAAALAACLAQRAPGASGEFRWRIDQGIEMGRPSRIEAEAEKRDGVVTVIRIGGNAVILAEGQMRVGAA